MRDKITNYRMIFCRQKSYLFPVILYIISHIVYITPPLYSEESADPEADAAEEEDEDYDIIMENKRGLTLTAPKDTPEHITQKEMEREGAADLWEAVRNVPGVVISGGGRRNDSNFSVRGYGADSVPVYVDGIEMANPYRGEGDAARFLTGDLESIDISKGYSSELLGANALGGIVTMRTAKPKEKLELSWKNSAGFDSMMKFADWTTVAGAGTKQKLFYGKAVFQYRDVDHFRLPASFEPVAYNPQESGDRLWSNSEDYKLTLLAGVTPGSALDIWASYIYQKADKGFSPPETRTREYSIWQWPRWDRHSISLNTVFDNNIFKIEGLFYFDKYDNTLIEYFNWKAYKLGIHHEPSDYDEYTLGGRVTGAWDINSRNTLRAAFTYKKEDHKGLDGGELGVHVQEDIISAGIEHSVTPFNKLTFRAGAGFDALLPLDFRGSENELMKLMELGYYIIKTRDMFLYTWQAGVFFKITDGHELRLTYARKNHFPTMSDRYSTRFGRRLPNSNLGPEIANHFEFGYRGFLLFNMLTVNTAVYYSLMNGKIVNIKLPNPEYPPSSVDYARNLDSVSFYGFELAPELELGKWFSWGAAFSLNRYKIGETFSGVKAIDHYPEITFNSYIVFTPAEFEAVRKAFSKSKATKHIREISLIPRAEYVSARAADTAESLILDGYFLAHIKLNIGVTRYFSVSFGAENIFDTYYEIRENFPLAGRTYNITVTVKY